MLANEPKCHVAQFKTQEPWFKYTKDKYWKKVLIFLCFHIPGLKKKQTKQNNKNGEDQKPNLTLDVMKMSAVVIRGYRQKHVPPSQKKNGCFETSLNYGYFPEPYTDLC